MIKIRPAQIRVTYSLNADGNYTIGHSNSSGMPEIVKLKKVLKNGYPERASYLLMYPNGIGSSMLCSLKLDKVRIGIGSFIVSPGICVPGYNIASIAQVSKTKITLRLQSK